MLNKTSLIIGATAVAFGMTPFASAAEQITRLVYIGGHNPPQVMRIESQPARPISPVLMSAARASTLPRLEAIRVGSRVVGYQRVAK